MAQFYRHGDLTWTLELIGEIAVFLDSLSCLKSYLQFQLVLHNFFGRNVEKVNSWDICSTELNYILHFVLNYIGKIFCKITLQDYVQWFHIGF